MIHATRDLQSQDLSTERELTLAYRHTFLTTQGHRESPRMRDRLNLWDNTNMKDVTHHPRINSFYQGEYERTVMTAKLYSGPCGPKASWHLSYRWGKTPEKTSPRKVVPTGESNPGPLRDRRACYLLFHSGGAVMYLTKWIRSFISAGHSNMILILSYVKRQFYTVYILRNRETYCLPCC